LTPAEAPPPRYDGQPSQFILSAGTRLTRVHSHRFAVTDFNSNLAQSSLQGGRFDATPEDPYGFFYAAEDDMTAVSEALLRDLFIDDRGARLLPRAALRARKISWLTTTIDLTLVDLRISRLSARTHG
jgi:hypothetical protein